MSGGGIYLGFGRKKLLKSRSKYGYRFTLGEIPIRVRKWWRRLPKEGRKDWLIAEAIKLSPKDLAVSLSPISPIYEVNADKLSLSA